MDYVILRTGTKQFRVSPGDVIYVDKLPVEEGTLMELTDVLAVSRDGETIIGDPRVPDTMVLAQVQSQERSDKIIVFKYKRKVRYRRKKGHRQTYTRLTIMGITHRGEPMGAVVEPEAVAIQEESLEEGIPEAPGDALALTSEDQPLAEMHGEVGKEAQEASTADEVLEPEDEIADVPQGEVPDDALEGTLDEPRGGGTS